MKDRKRMLMPIIGLYIFMQLSAPIIASAEKHPAENTANMTMVPFYWMVGIVGGSIAITLTYVSWRKYKGEKKKQTEDDSNN
ncbi:sporulation protein YpjB [Lentibacillus salinarum]|uniref:Sporulation protein YpjB n=1 Tax=Lentibacillus salinarum TaxID=446820 RepID=A0ABW3ZQD3_9BACI